MGEFEIGDKVKVTIAGEIQALPSDGAKVVRPDHGGTSFYVTDDNTIEKVLEPLQNNLPRRFELIRETDISGISGTGVVAYGCMFNDRTTVLRWNTETASTATYSDIDDVTTIHGHGGATRVQWID